MKTKNTNKFAPRTVVFVGMPAHPLIHGATWIESEMIQTDYGQFRRRGLVRHEKTEQLVRVRADIADTYFSIPATTDREHGYVTLRDCGEYGSDLVFVPHTYKTTQTPAEFRKETRKAYK